MTDVSSNVDASRNDPSLEASLGYPIPMKSSFESRIDIGESTYERLNQLHAVINGNASPRSEPVYSPSPSHSTYGMSFGVFSNSKAMIQNSIPYLGVRANIF